MKKLFLLVTQLCALLFASAVGIVNAFTSNLKERKKQIEIINGLRHFHKSLYDLFKTIVILKII